MKAFAELTEQEILALAISSEEDDSRTYLTFAHQLMDKFPSSARVFVEMAEEEQAHRRALTHAYQKKFGDFIPLAQRSPSFCTRGGTVSIVNAVGSRWIGPFQWTML